MQNSLHNILYIFGNTVDPEQLASATNVAGPTVAQLEVFFSSDYL